VSGRGRPTEPSVEARGLRFGVVASRFHPEVVENLLQEAIACLGELGVEEDSVTVVRVPGAFEIPLAARLLCIRGGVDAVVALGAVVRGETAHHAYLGQEVLSALLRVADETRVPVACGVLNTENEAQARARSRRGDPENRGRQAALAAVEMARLGRDLRG
jgi:6,7-dimethyl-8-ribityllumazine synthase